MKNERSDEIHAHDRANRTILIPWVEIHLVSLDEDSGGTLRNR